MALENGDFVLIDYSIRVKETGNLIDTSNEELARRENAHDPEKVYGAALLVVGKNWINQVVEDEIKKRDVGDEVVVEVPPERAFGARDPSKVRVFRVGDLRRRGIEARPGEVIDLGGVQGVVKSVSGGRVVIDFNHPLAGKTLVYRVKILSKLESLEDRARALAAKHLGIKGEELDVKYSADDKSLLVNVPTKYMSKRNLQYAKISLATDAFELFKDFVERVVFSEVIVRKKEPS